MYLKYVPRIKRGRQNQLWFLFLSYILYLPPVFPPLACRLYNFSQSHPLKKKKKHRPFYKSYESYGPFPRIMMRRCSSNIHKFRNSFRKFIPSPTPPKKNSCHMKTQYFSGLWSFLVISNQQIILLISKELPNSEYGSAQIVTYSLVFWNSKQFNIVGKTTFLEIR